MMVASVVFPSPGGPNNNTWSSASPRDFAASSAIASCSFAFVCPINSASRVGRRFNSNTASSSTRPAETNRSASAAREPSSPARFRSTFVLFLKESTQGDTKAKPRPKQPPLLRPSLLMQRQQRRPMRRQVFRHCIPRPQFFPHPQVPHLILRLVDKPVLSKRLVHMNGRVAKVEQRQIVLVPILRHCHPRHHVPILPEHMSRRRMLVHLEHSRICQQRLHRIVHLRQISPDK